jgi:predicted nucleic acid-binding protein
MFITANAGPLIALGRIGYLWLLPALYHEILVPQAVRHEVTYDPSRPGAVELLHATWLHSVSVTNHTAVQSLRLWLDLGESEALVLAQMFQTALLIDERRGRIIASARGISCIGTGRVLIDAKHQGHIPSVTPLLDALRTARVRLSPHLCDTIRRAAGE